MLFNHNNFPTELLNSIVRTARDTKVFNCKKFGIDSPRSLQGSDIIIIIISFIIGVAVCIAFTPPGMHLVRKFPPSLMHLFSSALLFGASEGGIEFSKNKNKK